MPTGFQPRDPALTLAMGNPHGRELHVEIEYRRAYDYPPDPPADGSLTREAQIEWFRVCQLLIDEAQLLEMDLSLVYLYANTFGRVKRIEAEIQKHFPFYSVGEKRKISYDEDDDGPKKKNKGADEELMINGYYLELQKAASKAAKECVDYLKELGLTPASRRAMRPPKKKEDEMESFLKDKG